MNTFFKIIVGLGCIVGIERFCHQATGSFSEAKIRSGLTSRPEWEPSEYPLLEPEVFDQPYRYLGKGAQCFAFVSEDGKYVIKFFRHDHLKKNGKFMRDFASYKIAFEEMREQTGLLYLHLNKTKQTGKTLTFFDKIGVVHHVALDEVEFLVQRKAELALPTLKKWMDAGEIDKAKEGIAGLVALVRGRCQKGIFDKDPDLRTNFGFTETGAIQLDTGRFRWDISKKESKNIHEEMRSVTKGLQQWLEKDYPALSAYLEQQLAFGQ